MKPGWKTTEFWVTAASTVGGIAALVAGLPFAPVAAAAGGVAAGAYAISRAVVKVRAGDVAGAIRDVSSLGPPPRR